MIGAVRAEVRTAVVGLAEEARSRGWGPKHFRAALVVLMGDAPPKSRARRVWLEELRRAKVPIRKLPDHRQLQLFGDAG